MWQQLVFLHIPKTAGWTLHDALLRVFGERHSLRVNTEEDRVQVRRMSAREFAQYRYVSGHFDFNDVKDKCGRDSSLVSILRDPVRRLVSEFNYMASWDEHPYHAMYKGCRLSEHVSGNAELLRGLQCHWLSGHRDVDRALAVVRDRYALVGTLADFDEFVAALARLIGVRLAPAKSNVTAGQGQIDLDSELCDALLEVTAEDRRLVHRIAALPDGVFAGGTISGHRAVSEIALAS
jgi:hypothetical protein